ncbi:MAG TPA: hypothetical protein VK436_02010 [Methanocella sp.]|nr:hypothetical protein [Methanocella sp.]
MEKKDRPAVGIDVGLTSFATPPNSKKVLNPRFSPKRREEKRGEGTRADSKKILEDGEGNPRTKESGKGSLAGARAYC